MNSIKSSKRRAALKSRFLVMAIGCILLSGTPLLIPSTADAQTSFNKQSNLGKSIRASSIQKDTLYLNSDRSYPYNLRVNSALKVGNLSIPAGSIIQGRYVPAKGGLRYVASGVVVKGRTYSINATSDVIKDVKDPRDTSAGAVAGDAAIGAAGGAVIGEIFGSVDAEEVIGGAVAGGVVGNVTADRVVVIKPNREITLYSR